MLGLHLVSVAVGVVVAQLLPVTVASYIKSKLASVEAAAAPVVAKVEAEVKAKV